MECIGFWKMVTELGRPPHVWRPSSAIGAHDASLACAGLGRPDGSHVAGEPRHARADEAQAWFKKFWGGDQQEERSSTCLIPSQEAVQLSKYVQQAIFKVPITLFIPHLSGSFVSPTLPLRSRLEW